MNLGGMFLKLYKSELKYIWSYTFDEGTNNELILDPKCVFLEIDDRLLQLSDKERSGDIKITISDREIYTSDMEITYKIDVSRFIFEYPETNYFIEKIGGIDMLIDTEKIVCKAVEIHLFTEHYGKQMIFIHAGIYGLRIGGIKLKEDWIDHYYIPVHENSGIAPENAIPHVRFLD